MPKTKHYSQRNHLKKARNTIRKSSKTQINNEDTIESNIASTINSIANSTETIINPIASQIKVTVATQTEVVVSTITTQTEAIIIQSNEIQIDQVNQADYNELLLAHSLMQTMRYKKGPNIGKLFSQYLQQKAAHFIDNSYYQAVHEINKCTTTIKSLETQINSLTYHLNLIKVENKSLHAKIGKFIQICKQQISKSRSNASKTKAYTINKEGLKTAIKQHLMENKHKYTAKTVQMATRICQIGKMSYRSAVECTKAVVEWLIDEEPNKWFSVKTLIGWHNDVAKIYLNQQSNIIESFKFSVYGIMADESKRGDCKIFICFTYWNSNANLPQATLLEMKDLSNCSGSTVANIVAETCITYKINPQKCYTWTTDNTAYMSGSKSGAITLFNNKILSDSFRISCGMHSAHIMITHFENSAFGKLDVNTGFSTQKHPFNLLYLIWQLHNGYDETKKENLMNSIEKFTKWFIEKPKTHKDSPKQYISQWKLLHDWLEDPLLKIQVKFGEAIYEPIMNFLAGFDSTPRILEKNGEHTKLPSGRRAHEMPDAVTQWIDNITNIINNICSFFEDELLNAMNSLNNTEFQILVVGLTSGVEAALDSLEKWLGMWLYLPLSMCRLGGDRVILKVSLNHNPTIKEECYIKELENEIDMKPELQDFEDLSTARNQINNVTSNLLEDSTQYDDNPWQEIRKGRNINNEMSLINDKSEGLIKQNSEGMQNSEGKNIYDYTKF
ncbi:35001_t:CDS:2 [Gigaspora margarita]|uniref:35001_t:CDS:1 n=1 Tax=Gigaspora margarita TaxID=4874 RepID=A0ABN7V8L7_GIGMA|nr:35001_t:CDS:2 [Gigaspora margarita]